MNRDEEHRWSAYLDGELSAGEANEFDRTLSDADRRRLEAELRLEAGVAERLAAAPSCPDLVWKRVQQEVWRANGSPQPARASAARFVIPFLAAAAVILIAVAMLVPSGPGDLTPFLELAAADEPAAAELSECEASRAEIESYLRQAGMRVKLTPEIAARSRHAIHEVGARREMYDGQQYIRIFYQCCREPVEVIVAPQEGPVARAILTAHEEGRLKNSRLVGPYVVTVVGDAHHVPEVMALINPD